MLLSDCFIRSLSIQTGNHNVFVEWNSEMLVEVANKM